MKKTFYYDSQPPLGKQLIAIVGWIVGYDGSNVFDSIGAGENRQKHANFSASKSPITHLCFFYPPDYPDSVPLKALRFLPCLCGSLLVPLTYQIALELKLNHKFALLASLFALLGKRLG